MSTAKTMSCPDCGAWTVVLETRTPKTQPHTKTRRYECANGHRFTTKATEVVVETRKKK